MCPLHGGTLLVVKGQLGTNDEIANLPPLPRLCEQGHLEVQNGLEPGQVQALAARHLSGR